MKTRKLGPDGPEVGAIGFGGMPLSIVDRPEEPQAIRTIHAALDAGVTFIDTADVYCRDENEIGHNERLIRKALEGRREKVIVATKGGMKRPNGAWTRDGRPEHIREACEQSLKALGVDVIDLYQLHVPDPTVKLADSIGALADLRTAGKIRWVGLSNVGPKQIEFARTLVPIHSVQNRYNITTRSSEHDGVLATCEEHGIAFLAHSPFGGRQRAASVVSLAPLVIEARNRGVSAYRLILSWMLAKSPVIIPIPGARRPETIVDSAAAADFVLPSEDIPKVEKAFHF